MKQLTMALLDAAHTVAKEVGAKTILLYVDAISDCEVLRHYSKDVSLLLVARDRASCEAARQVVNKVVLVPPLNLTRMGQIKLAVLTALSRGMLSRREKMVCLSGVADLDTLDTLIVLDLTHEGEILVALNETPLAGDVKPEVFERVLDLATELAKEGREGKPVGTIFVVGDHEAVSRNISQLVINPFKGYDEAERNILNPAIDETVKEFALLDGAFIIREDGVLLSAGTYLYPAAVSEDLVSGLGTRHQVAASMSAATKAIVVTVSESTGTVRVFKGGRIITEIERPRK
jgi:DNA integrity scanning protein DisA with diadenylate cyclase activity